VHDQLATVRLAVETDVVDANPPQLLRSLDRAKQDFNPIQRGPVYASAWRDVCVYAIAAGRELTQAVRALQDGAKTAIPRGDVERMSTAKNIGITATVLVLLALYATACGSSTDTQFIHTEEISKSTFKGTWPLIPGSGVLACDTSKGDAITFTPTGTNTTYAVNATAGSRAKQEGWQRDLQHIWLTADGGQNDIPGVPRLPLSDFINEGLKLCGNRSSPPSPVPQPALPSSQPSQTVPNPHTTQVELPFTGLNGPDDVAVDSVGNVYVADDDNNRVLKLRVGSNTQVELPFTRLNRPEGVAVDSVGNRLIRPVCCGL
jgi:DNA-binding beta-propeller fold protein YncE